MKESVNQISTFNEKPLHAALKEWYGRAGDRFEVPMDGYIVDIVRDGLLIEIQTRHFTSLKHKLAELTASYPVRLVYPVARAKWIVKLPKKDGATKSRRKSPKRGAVEQVFRELVSFPELLNHPNFSLDVLLIHEEEVRRYDGTRAWRRRGWVTEERRLLKVVDTHYFADAADMAALIPQALEQPFTTAGLASALEMPRWLAQKMAYCLREMGAITQVGTQGRSYLYCLTRG
jgi:hypothetical protein